MKTYPVVRFTRQGAELEGGRCVDCYTLVYDGECAVCMRIVTALRRMDEHGVLSLVPYQAPGVRARFPWIPRKAFEESVQLIGPDGTTWQGARAVEEVLRLLPKSRWLALLFRVPFVRPLAERFYRWFARNRHRLGCGMHCTYRPPTVDFGG